MIIGLVEHKTNIRFKNMDGLEVYINATDNGYDSEDVTFTGYVFKLNNLNSMLLNEAFIPKVLILCKSFLNIVDKTVVYQLLECVLSNVIFTLLRKIIQKNL